MLPDSYHALDQNNQLIWNFRDIGHTMRHIFEGRGSQKRILIVLKEKGRITQRELTQYLGIQPGSASEVLRKLEAAGLIVRTASEADHRTTDIDLTEAGLTEAEKACVQREERHRQMFSCLSQKERDTLLALLERVNWDWNQRFLNQTEGAERKREEHR